MNVNIFAGAGFALSTSLFQFANKKRVLGTISLIACGCLVFAAFRGDC